MSYVTDMKSRLPVTMSLPAEFEALFTWIEANGFFMQSTRFPGDRLGMLGPAEPPYHGTVIMFRVETPEQAQDTGASWCGCDVSDISDRLVTFARTGGDGSHVAFWIDDQGKQQIVHLGSEGAFGILTSTPLDFLRLLSIGYEEISGDCQDAPDAPPNSLTFLGQHRTVVNAAYQSWLTERYGVTIPRTASEVMHDLSRPDAFRAWMEQLNG